MQIPPPPPSPPRSGGWSIYTRPDITDRYEILDRVGSGTYSDVYRGRRRADGLIVALKEVHDCQSAYREIEALQVLQGSPNVISLFDYFWRDDDDAVLVLEFLDTDLASVISDARRNRDSGIPSGEVKRWMLQILQGVDACHRNSIVHRDLKPANLLVSAAGVLKLADFGQSRILLPDQTFRPAEDSQNRGPMLQQQRPVNSCSEGSECQTVAQPEPGLVMKQSYLEEDTGEEAESIQDGNASCLATCTTSDMAEYEVDDDRGGDPGAFTSCVGTRWFRAPELLYGSEKYGTEIDLWSLGCIFAELLTLQPLFPGSSDIDQLSRIISVLGDLNEAAWPGCSNLPDYGKMFFSKVENPLGLESCLPNRSVSEVNMVKRLVCYEPQSRATPMELLQDKYLNEEPFPVALNELRVPSSKDMQEDDSPRQWGHGGDLSDSDLDFSGVDVTTTSTGFSIRFS